MANEILISAVTGLTPSIQLYSGATPVGSPFSATEIGTTGEYFASMPSVAFGNYLVLVTVGGTTKLCSGEIKWDGQYEVMDSLAKLRGLDPNNPWTVTPTQESVGGILLNITGDGETSSVLTRDT